MSNGIHSNGKSNGSSGCPVPEDIGKPYSWLCVGTAAGAVLATTAVLGKKVDGPQSRWALKLAAGAALTSTVASAAGLLLVYKGVPAFQPSGWKPPSKRERNCGKVKFSEKEIAKRGTTWDVIVVGSGMGGLTCASVLAQFGYKVLVLEAHEVAGGSTHDYVVDGKNDWKFPSGLHYTIPASEEMLQVACGAARPPVAFPSMGDDTVLNDGAYDRVRLTRTDDPELRIISDKQISQELKKRFPNLVPQIERYERIATGVLISFPVWCALHVVPWTARPALMKALLPSVWWNYAGRTGEDALEELFADAPDTERENVRKLQGYLCGLWLDSGCTPDRVSFFMIAAVGVGFPNQGGAYPAKGTGEMAATLIECLEAHGGSCLVRAPVARILMDNEGRAVGVETTGDAGSTKLYANNCVVSACGWRNTTRLCKGSKFPDIGDLALPQGDGFVMANIGIKGSATTLGLECTNMELLPVGNGMSVFEGVRKFLADPLGVPPMEIPTMITFPSVKDRAYKRNGSEETARESCQLLVMAKTEWFGKIPEPELGTTTTPAWKHPERSADYAKIKAKWVERLQVLLLTVYPQLKGKLDMFDISTPLSIEHYLPTVSGSAIGLDTNGGKHCRFTDFSIMKLLDMKTPVPNLWLTGQDALMIGVPLAQGAGLIAAVRIGGPLKAAGFAFKSLWLLTASLGAKSRSKS